jgi:hypothetical protein
MVQALRIQGQQVWGRHEGASVSTFAMEQSRQAVVDMILLLV